MMKYVMHIAVAIMSLMCNSLLFAARCGSNAASSRQAKAFFPANHSNNSLSGFSVFENGFILENSVTTCTFDAFFPVSGTVALNRGTLTLERDLVFKSPLRLGPGSIVCNHYAIEFPRNVSEITIPKQGHQKLLEKIVAVDVGNDLYAIDWSFDDSYVAVGCKSKLGNFYEVQVYQIVGSSLVLFASYDAGLNTVNSLSWHPSEYYLAVGQDGGDHVTILSLNTQASSLVVADSMQIGAVSGLSWHPSGSVIAVGLTQSQEIRLYGVSGGLLDNNYSSAQYDLLITDTTQHVTRTLPRNSLDWDPTGNYLAVGLASLTNYKELKLFGYDGNNITLLADKEIGATLYAVSWHPSELILACGKSGGFNRLMLLEFDAVNNIFTELNQAGDNKAVYSLQWSVDGQYLIAGSQAGTEHMEVRVFCYDYSDDSVELVSGYEASTNVRSVRWSHNGNYAASGDDLNNFTLFSLKEQQLAFRDARLFFGSDVRFTGPLHFEGTCVVNGGGHILDLSGTSSFVVHPHATLIIEDAMVRTIHGDKIKCLDSTGTIVLRDMHWLQDGNMTFSVGSMQWKSEVTMGGDATFVYKTDQYSLVQDKTQLIFDVGFTFSYDPGSPAQDLIDFVDHTSEIIMNGATLHATVTGLALRKGSMQVRRDSTISSETKLLSDGTPIDYGIILGNRSISLYDFNVELLSGAALTVKSGSLVYKNLSSSSWHMESDRSLLRIGQGSSLQLYESIDLGDGAITFADNTTFARIQNRNLVGTVNTQGTLAYTNIGGS